MLLLWLQACALRPNVATDDRSAALVEIDARWSARAEPGNLDAAMDLLLTELAGSHDDPRVLARLARGEWTRGQLGAGAVHYELAQDYGYRCLLGWSGFASQLDVGGYRVTPEAAAQLPGEAAPCLLWTVASGLALVEGRGPGGALELESLEALLGRLEALGGGAATDSVGRGFAPWAAAKLQLLGRSPDTQEVRRLLGQAIAEEPGVLLFRVELAEALPDTRNVALDGFAPPVPDPWGLENAAWRGRMPDR